MTITHWLTLIAVLGVAYAASLFLVARKRYQTWKASGANGLLGHVATGDVRAAGKNVLLALLLLIVFASPLFINEIGRAWFGLIQQTAAILLLSIFVVGMAFERIHQQHQP